MHAGMDEDRRRMYLHGIIAQGNTWAKEQKRGNKLKPRYVIPDLQENNLSHKFCRNAIRRIFCIGKEKWALLVKGDPPPKIIPNPKKVSLKNRQHKCYDDVVAFITKIAEENGESYATRFIRELTGIGVRDAEKGVMELPSFMRKRDLYRRFFFERGWVAREDAKGNYHKTSNYDKRLHDDEWGDLAEWPSGSVAKEVCCWETFYGIWERKLPLIKVRPRSRDICTDCFVFKNLYKFKFHRMTTSVSTNEDDGNDSDDYEETETETLIMTAYEHVASARIQKELARSKMQKAQIDWVSNRLCSVNKGSITLVMDYCMNLTLPHLGEEQPGDSYFYSPMFLYVLGIVDTGTHKLTSYVYQESEGKKGGNNTSSLLIHYLKEKIIRESNPYEELNVIMDNCTGQNKNRMMIKAGCFLVEQGWFGVVNLIFLVKGHTKNVADRMFNVLKMSWRKQNIYSMEKAVEVLGESENVDIVKAKGLFLNYDSYFDKFYTNPQTGSVLTNHCFSFTIEKNCELNKRVMMKTKLNNNSSTYAKQRMVTTATYKTLSDRIAAFITEEPDKLEEPGLCPRKIVDLYKKWRKIVPDEFKDSLCPQPSDEIIELTRKSKGKKTKKRRGIIADGEIRRSTRRKKGVRNHLTDYFQRI